MHDATPLPEAESLRDRLIEAAPCNCERCRALLRLLAESAPTLPSASEAAVLLGFRDRHKLARHLGRHHLPSFQALADWIRVLHWLDRWEGSAMPLSRQNWGAGTEPSVGYRTVVRITGMTWLELRRLGFSHCLEQFRRSAQSVRIPIDAALHAPDQRA